MIITIDGKSGLGKSSIADGIADRLGLVHINSGNLYRYITWKLLGETERIEDKACILSESIDIIQANNVRNEILRSKEVNSKVNRIASYEQVRKNINYALKNQLIEKNFVIDGRDMFQLFPDATYKFYFRVSAEDRLWLATEINGKTYSEAIEMQKIRDTDEPEFQLTDDVIIFNPIHCLRTGYNSVSEIIRKCTSHDEQ